MTKHIRISNQLHPFLTALFSPQNLNQSSLWVEGKDHVRADQPKTGRIFIMRLPLQLAAVYVYMCMFPPFTTAHFQRRVYIVYVCMHVPVLFIIATLLSAIASHSYCGTTNSLYQATDNRL